MKRHYLDQSPRTNIITPLEVVLTSEDEDIFSYVVSDKDIQNKTYGDLLRLVNTYRNIRDWQAFFECVSAIQEFFPHEIMPDISNDFRWMLDMLLRYRDENDYYRFTSLLYILTKLYPEKKEEFQTDEFFRFMLNRLKSLLSVKEWMGFSSDCFTMCQIFPDRQSEIVLGDETFDDILKGLEIYRSQNEWWKFIFVATRLFVLYPSRRSELGMNRETYGKFFKLLEECQKNKNTETFHRIEWMLSILSSERAYIDDRGKIVIVPKKKNVVTSRQPMPKTGE